MAPRWIKASPTPVLAQVLEHLRAGQVCVRCKSSRREGHRCTPVPGGAKGRMGYPSMAQIDPSTAVFWQCCFLKGNVARLHLVLVQSMYPMFIFFGAECVSNVYSPPI